MQAHHTSYFGRMAYRQDTRSKVQPQPSMDSLPPYSPFHKWKDNSILINFTIDTTQIGIIAVMYSYIQGGIMAMCMWWTISIIPLTYMER